MSRIIMRIKKIFLEEKAKTVKLVADIIRDREKFKCWFEYPISYKEYICTERCDAFVIALLPYALEKNMDIVSDIPISEQLLYQIENYYVPTLSKYNKMFNSIKLQMPYNNKNLNTKGEVATGLSCGVDSFYTLLKHMNDSITKDYKITYLVSMNVGSFGYDGGSKSYSWFQEELKVAHKVAHELSIPLIEINSNLMEFYNRDHATSGTFRMAGAILGIQKLISKYYISAGFDIKDFDITSSENDDYDLFNLMVASNESTTFYSSGVETSRYERTKYISDYSITYNNLIVCWHGVHNCGYCEKCLRTLGTLYALNKLEKYSGSFNIDNFQKHKLYNLAKIRYYGIGYMKPLYKEIYRDIKQKSIWQYIEICFLAYIFVFPTQKIKFWAKKILTNILSEGQKNRLKEKINGKKTG